jgi:LmbE family N-acetylglucosaminyl deacetylase
MLRHLLLLGCLVAGLSFSGFAQPLLDRVLTQSGPQFGARDLPQDRGAAGVWQKLLKLQTTGSVLHTTAHPDDEHADLLTYLGRGAGARTALLSLNRGEGGANVLGPELFDALGVLRTEEMLLAGTYYGLDDLYFTGVADYGYSKRVAEAYDKWDAQHVLGELVRVIRLNRPLVVISRFHGSARDGHGNHQAAGELTRKAFGLAGDPNAFPEQITREGLRPWQPRKLYRGGIRTGEKHHYVLESGKYSPWLGSSYKNFSLLGYSFHRSQFSGVRREVPGSAGQRYERLQPSAGNAVESSPFVGLDTSVGGVFALTGETPPKGVARLVEEIETAINKAVAVFRWQRPEASVPALAAALEKTRRAERQLDGQPEARFLLLVKERQLVEAIHAALGVSLRATAAPATLGASTPSFFAPPPALPAAVPGQPFAVAVTFLNPSGLPITLQRMEVNRANGWQVEPEGPKPQPLKKNEPLESRFTVTLPAEATYPGPYFYRTSPGASRYEVREPAHRHLPYGPAALSVTATYLVEGQAVEVRQPVLTREANLPYGYIERTLRVLTPIAVSLSPAAGIIPLMGMPTDIPVQVQLVSYAEGNATGTLRLSLPPGWRATPGEIPFTFSHAGEKRSFPVRVTPVVSGPGPHVLRAVAVVDGREYDAGYQLVAHRDQDRHYVSGPAEMRIAGVDVRVAPGLKVGYVMGAGDDIPAALAQLGVAVHLLTPADLANADLDGFGTVIGRLPGLRRAARLGDLQPAPARLRGPGRSPGGAVPDAGIRARPACAFPGGLPPEAEEVSEEDAPVELLAADHPLLNAPNKITAADFDGWIEQRGSKFFSRWDAAYLPLLASHDQGQAPQRGGWLTAPTGKGHYTYFAYALHRQLPYGVPGAYRLLANLASYGR